MDETEEREIAAAAGIDGEDPNLQAAVFGREVEYFIETDPIGRYLIEQAKRDLAEVQAQLLVVDPEDAKGIRALQNRAAVALKVREYLGAAVANGRDAAIVLQQERDEHGT